MSAPIKQVSFSGGEIAPALYGRTDHLKYETGLRTLRNMIAMRHGGATMRPGTKYVGTTLNSFSPVRLIPFIFNETGNGQSYVLEFGNLYVAFYQNGGVVTSGGVPYKVVTPYLQAELATLNYDQCADVMTIVHQNHTPAELKRLGPTNWTLTPIAFAPTIGGPVGLTHSGGGSGSYSYGYAVSAVAANGDETDTASVHLIVVSGVAQVTLSNPIALNWTALAGAVSYKIYKIDSTSTGTAIPGLAYIGTTTSPVFTDTGIAPDYTHQLPQYNSLFTGTGNFPSTVGFIQQRRGFANTINNPIGFWLSRPGSFSNFDVHITPNDSDPVISSLAGSEVNSIQAILEQKFALFLTTGAEIYVQGNGSGVITPGEINASTQSQYGCSGLKPLKVGDVLLFNQALGSFIRDFAFDFAIDGYRGNDITVFSSHLFEGFTLTDWAFQKVPDSIVWAVRNDGTLLGLTYVREQQILAWHHHDFTNGAVENVCAIPENGEYALYLSIRRVILGFTFRYIERMSSRIWSDDLNATYLDCYSSYNGINTGPAFMVLSTATHFITDGTAFQQSLFLTTDSPFFTSGMIGDQIFLSDALYVSSRGAKGNQVRCTIQTFTNAFSVRVTPNRAVPTEFQNLEITNWAHAVKTVSGLGYLAGQQVSVWADRFVVGSPLNPTIQKVYTVQQDGTLTLDKPYAVIYVGLPIVADFQTLDLETSFGETILASRKRTNKLAIYLLNSRGFFVGSENPDKNFDNTAGDSLFQLEEFKRGTDRQTYDQPPDLVTDQDFVLMDSRWNRNGRLFIRNCDPVPLSILAVSPGGESRAPSPFYEKV